MTNCKSYSSDSMMNQQYDSGNSPQSNCFQFSIRAMNRSYTQTFSLSSLSTLTLFGLSILATTLLLSLLVLLV